MSEEYGDAALGYHLNVNVAVLDTGVDYAHSDLRGTAAFYVVSLGNRRRPTGADLKNYADPNGHGAHVAGIVAARLIGVASKLSHCAVSAPLGCLAPQVAAK